MSAQTYEDFLRGQAEKAQYGVVIIPARTALDMADFIEKKRANDTDINVGGTISRQAAIDAAHKNYDTILDFKSDGHTVADSFEDIINALPPAQPDIIYCKDCKHWRQQTNYQGALLSFGFCESDDMWCSLYGETTEVAHIDTDDNHYCGYAERRTE